MLLSRFLPLTLLSVLSLFPSTTRAQNESDFVRWVVTLKEGILPDQVNDLLDIAGIEIPEIPLVIPELFMEVFMMDTRIAKLVAKLPVVDFVEQDVKMQMVEPVSKTDGLPQQQARQVGEYAPYGINMVQALEVDASNIGNRMVCVIDSGYDLGHEDLPGASLVTGSDDIGVQPWFQDDADHGTHVSGTIAALGNNGKGVIGVANSGQLPLHIVRIFDETGQSFSSNTVADVQACVNAGANVVSMSFGRSDEETRPLGYEGPLAFEQRAFDSFLADGILLVAAAGNDGSDSYSWPASYDSVMSVAAIDESKQVASFSQKNDGVDISAPGVEVASTIPNDRYAFYSGTSMACPHVSGVAALVWSNFPGKTAQEIWNALIASAEDLGPTGRDDSYGYGLVQAKAAMDLLASGDAIETPTPAPSTPTPAPGECQDDTTWTDAFGDDCEWYTNQFLCRSFGRLAVNDGQTASDACCTCGGGLSVAGATSDGAVSTTALPLLASLVSFVLVAVAY